MYSSYTGPNIPPIWSVQNIPSILVRLNLKNWTESDWEREREPDQYRRNILNRSNRRNIWSIRSVQNIPLIAEQIFLYSGLYIHRIQVNIFFLSKLIYSSYSGPYIPPILVLILPTILVHIVILFRSIYSSYSGQYIFLLFRSIYIPPILVNIYSSYSGQYIFLLFWSKHSLLSSTKILPTCVD